MKIVKGLFQILYTVNLHLINLIENPIVWFKARSSYIKCDVICDLIACLKHKTTHRLNKKKWWNDATIEFLGVSNKYHPHPTHDESFKQNFTQKSRGFFTEGWPNLFVLSQKAKLSLVFTLRRFVATLQREIKVINKCRKK